MFLKNKGIQYEKYERHNIVYKDLKAKIKYCLLEATDIALESIIIKIGNAFKAMYDWFYNLINICLIYIIFIFRGEYMKV